MKKILFVAAFVFVALLIPRKGDAQGLKGIDTLTPPLPTTAERKAADIASWVTVGANVALDLTSTINDCRDGGDCRRALTLAGTRYGVTFGATQLLKVLVHRERPCAPDGCGIDNPNYSFPSGHTAFAFTALGGPRLEVALPLAIGTGGLRVMAGKHWVTDTLAGAAIGALASRIR